MPKTKLHVPKIRFTDFTDNWFEQSFREITKLSQGLQIAICNRYLEPGENREFYITNEFLNPKSLNKYYIENPSTNVMAYPNDILMTRTGNTGKVVTNVKGAFHNNFFKIKYNESYTNKLYLYYVLTSQNIQNEILTRAGTSTIPDLNHSDFYSIKTFFPDVSEQTKIGSFFQKIDQVITLQQKTLETALNYKKSMLQKIFPQKGSKVPQVRFAGFSKSWKEMNLKDIAEINPSSCLPEIFNYIDLESVKGNRIISCRTEYKKTSPSRAQRLAKKGDVFYQTVRPYQKNNYFFDSDKENYVFSTGYTQLRPLTHHSGIFIFAQIQNEHFVNKVLERCTGTSYPAINSTDLSLINIVVPILEEQQKIGLFFQKLDQQIEQHQKKLENYQNLKKAMLQRMFV